MLQVSSTWLHKVWNKKRNIWKHHGDLAEAVFEALQPRTTSIGRDGLIQWKKMLGMLVTRSTWSILKWHEISQTSLMLLVYESHVVLIVTKHIVAVCCCIFHSLRMTPSALPAFWGKFSYRGALIAAPRWRSSVLSSSHQVERRCSLQQKCHLHSFKHCWKRKMSETMSETM